MKAASTISRAVVMTSDRAVGTSTLTLYSAAVRETREETGLTVQAVETIGQVTSSAGDSRVVLHLVLCRPIAGEAAPTSPAVTEVRWAGLDELRHLAMPPANAEILEKLGYSPYNLMRLQLAAKLTGSYELRP